MMGMLEAAQRLSMDVDSPTAVQGIFHSWALPGWAHGARLCPEPCSEVAEHPPGCPCQRPSGRGILTVQWCPGRHREPREPWAGCPHLPGGFRPGQGGFGCSLWWWEVLLCS